MLAIISKFLSGKFFAFCIVGTIGFIIDACILQLGLSVFHLSPLPARIPAFSTAVLATWYFNRNFTFRQREKKSFLKSFPVYVTSNMVGLSLNFGVYSAGILLSPFLAQYPVAALACGSVTAMFFNFFMSNSVIFSDKDKKIG
jgi:putative flippase GtrA